MRPQARGSSRIGLVARASVQACRLLSDGFALRRLRRIVNAYVGTGRRPFHPSIDLPYHLHPIGIPAVASLHDEGTGNAIEFDGLDGPIRHGRLPTLAGGP